MPTLEEAVETLYEIINSGILDKELESKLESVAKCIEEMDSEEHLALWLWGAEDTDWVDLFVAKREDLITDEWKSHLNEVYEKYRIKEPVLELEED